MDPGPSNYDYTEGASAIDISDAVSNSRRSRRDSQYSLPYDDQQGTMFDGPGHSVVPSSVSRMSIDRPRSRRRSEDSEATRPFTAHRRSSDMISTWSQALDDSAPDEEEIGERVPLYPGRR